MEAPDYELSSNDRIIQKHKATYTQIIAFGFLVIIVVGAGLLSLPISSKDNTWTSYFDSLFTATSATCVTGLVLFDTYTHWSVFGQLVILLMIQIGGLGFMSVITTVSIFMGRRISLHERKLLMQSAGNTKLSGMIQLVRRIFFGTLIFETAGAILLATRFCPEMGFLEGIYNAVFHSVSAFCNAGFDLMGKFEPNSSLIHYQSDPVVNLTVCGLIVIGGLGFMVWNNIIKSKLDFKHYSLHTKIVLSITAILLVSSTVLFFILDKDKNFAGLSTNGCTHFFRRLLPELPDLTLPIYLRSQKAALCLQPCLCLSEEAPAQQPEVSKPQLLSFYSLWRLRHQEKTITL